MISSSQKLKTDLEATNQAISTLRHDLNEQGKLLGMIASMLQECPENLRLWEARNEMPPTFHDGDILRMQYMSSFDLFNVNKLIEKIQDYRILLIKRDGLERQLRNLSPTEED